MKKLAVVISHPIQYYAPVFRHLAESGEMTLRVFYTWGEGSIKKFDPGFQREVEWDIPLLEGYDYRFVRNVSGRPGTSHYKGIDNPTILKDINAFEPDAILVYGWSWKSHLKVMRHFSGRKPVWFRGDSNLVDERTGWKSALRYLLLRWVYRHVDVAFYVGSATKAYFRNFGLQESQLRWAPHAIDNARFGQPRMEEVEQLKAHLNIPRDSKIVLFAGKLEPKKDPLTLIEAFSQIDDSTLFLLIVGNGVLEPAVKKAALESRAAGRVRFMDFQNQEKMPIVYQTCHLFCLPSRGPGETWGLAVNEAMAAGRAVLVSNKVGCSADLVREGINGSVFEAGNAAELNRKLADLTSDARLLSQMGEKSRQMIGEWSFERQSKSFLDAIKSNNLES